MSDSTGGYVPPSIAEFFPPAILFEGTPFELNRIILIRILVTVLLVTFFVLAARGAKVVPRGIQNVGEFAVDFVRINIAEEILGKVQGRRFMPILATIFFSIFAMNITGIVPLLNISPNSLIGYPLVLAVLAYVTFIYAGIKRHGVGGFFKHSLVLPGVPPALHVLLIPIEFISTFIMRPLSLTIRLLANMLAGHIMLVLFFSATQYMLFEAGAELRAFSAASLLMGFFITLFEILVSVLQAYIFALLAAVYIDQAVSTEH